MGRDQEDDFVAFVRCLLILKESSKDRNVGESGNFADRFARRIAHDIALIRLIV